jgi:hypothetical protein
MTVASATQLHNPPGFQIDLGLLQEFERGLDPRSPGNSRIPARVLGYGEISTVLEIQAEACRGLAFKRLSIFESPAEIERYLASFVEYMRLLEDDIGSSMFQHSAGPRWGVTSRSKCSISWRSRDSSNMYKKWLRFSARALAS